MTRASDRVPGLARRLVVGFVGAAVLLVGVVMIVLPGPATLIIPAGLAILATEFPWARRLLERLRAAARALVVRASAARRRGLSTSDP